MTVTQVVVVQGDDDDDDDDEEEEEEVEEVVDDDEDDDDHHDHKRGMVIRRHDITQTQTRITDNATDILVHLHGLGLNEDVNLTVACLEALNWPIQMWAPSPFTLVLIMPVLIMPSLAIV